MKRYGILVVGVLTAAVCMRLGVWQLDRLDQRKDRNAIIQERQEQQPVDLVGDRGILSFSGADSLHYRRATAKGTFDFEREVVVMARVYRGVPGAYVITPLVMAGDTAVLVERGWAPAPDGRAVELSSLRESSFGEIEGVFMPPPEGGQVQEAEPAWPRYERAANAAVLSQAYPYQLVPLVLRRTGGPGALPLNMRPVALPELTNGPHLSYAMQWFAFAAIAMIGSIVLAVRLGGEKPVRIQEEPDS